MFLEEDDQTAWRSNRGARLLRALCTPITRRLSWIFRDDGPLVSSGSYTTGAYYYYLLEMDDAGAIIDGEWVYDSDRRPGLPVFPEGQACRRYGDHHRSSYTDASMLACSGSSLG
ncbi:hypothetical protein PRIC1_005464 [Phytophthora ramorum]